MIRVTRNIKFKNISFKYNENSPYTHLNLNLDIRKNSKTYGKYVSVLLSGENKRQLFIPKGFAHGFLVLSDNAILNYKVDNIYAPDHEAGVRWNDKGLNIKWGVDSGEVIVSEKDAKLPFFLELESPFTI